MKKKTPLDKYFSTPGRQKKPRIKQVRENLHLADALYRNSLRIIKERGEVEIDIFEVIERFKQRKERSMEPVPELGLIEDMMVPEVEECTPKQRNLDDLFNDFFGNYYAWSFGRREFLGFKVLVDSPPWTEDWNWKIEKLGMITFESVTPCSRPFYAFLRCFCKILINMPDWTREQVLQWYAKKAAKFEADLVEARSSGKLIVHEENKRFDRERKLKQNAHS